jgi:quinol monooxygenase YgiN
MLSGELAMQTFGLNYQVKPESAEDFKAALVQLIETMKAYDGHVETKLYADVTQPNSMMIYSDWRTKAEFAAFFRSETFKDALGKTTGMLESSPTHMAGQDIRLVKNPG